MKHLSSTILLVLAVASCARPITMRPADVAGTWARPGDAFPPVNLTLIDSQAVLRARLRLSGIDAKGTATLDGRRLRLVLEGRPGEITGEFVSATELRLQFGGVRDPYTLYRRDHRMEPDPGQADASHGSLRVNAGRSTHYRSRTSDSVERLGRHAAVQDPAGRR